MTLANNIGPLSFIRPREEKQQAEQIIRELTDEKVFNNPIVTQLQPLDKFYEAENYHRDYYQNNPGNPYCQVVINPKLAKFKQKFAALLKAS